MLRMVNQMDAKTKERFANVSGGVLKEKRGHVPELRIRGGTVAVHCSCGVRIYRATGCNPPGIAHAIGEAKYAYRRHTGQAGGESPAMAFAKRWLNKPLTARREP